MYIAGGGAVRVVVADTVEYTGKKFTSIPSTLYSSAEVAHAVQSAQETTVSEPHTALRPTYPLAAVVMYP